MRAIAALLLVTLSLSACFSYRTIDPALSRQRDDVRVRLSRPIDVRLTEITANDVVQVDGEVISAADTVLYVSAWALRSRSGFSILAQGETVAIPTAGITELERKRISALRSSAVVAGVLALSTVIFGAVRGGAEGEGPGPGGNPTPK